MKKIILSTLVVLSLLLTVNYAFSNDSNNKKSININPAIALGTEFGPSIRIEYENKDWGKLICDASAGIILGGGDHLMLDLGVGYGYPLRYSEKNSIFLNGYLSFIQLGVPIGMHSYEAGPSALIEFEYRKTWNKFSINIAPGFRYLHSFSSHGGHFNHGSARVRLGVMYSFNLNQ